MQPSCVNLPTTIFFLKNIPQIPFFPCAGFKMPFKLQICLRPTTSFQNSARMLRVILVQYVTKRKLIDEQQSPSVPLRLQWIKKLYS